MPYTLTFKDPEPRKRKFSEVEKFRTNSFSFTSSLLVDEAVCLVRRDNFFTRQDLIDLRDGLSALIDQTREG